MNLQINNWLFVIYFLYYYFQDAKFADRLLQKHGQNVEEKMVTICSGLDYVNINLTNIVCKDAEEAQVVLFF